MATGSPTSSNMRMRCKERRSKESMKSSKQQQQPFWRMLAVAATTTALLLQVATGAPSRVNTGLEGKSMLSMMKKEVVASHHQQHLTNNASHHDLLVAEVVEGTELLDIARATKSSDASSSSWLFNPMKGPSSVENRRIVSKGSKRPSISNARQLSIHHDETSTRMLGGGTKCYKFWFVDENTNIDGELAPTDKVYIVEGCADEIEPVIQITKHDGSVIQFRLHISCSDWFLPDGYSAKGSGARRERILKGGKGGGGGNGDVGIGPLKGVHGVKVYAWTIKKDDKECRTCATDKYDKSDFKTQIAQLCAANSQFYENPGGEHYEYNCDNDTETCAIDLNNPGPSSTTGTTTTSTGPPQTTSTPPVTIPAVPTTSSTIIGEIVIPPLKGEGVSEVCPTNGITSAQLSFPAAANSLPQVTGATASKSKGKYSKNAKKGKKRDRARDLKEEENGIALLAKGQRHRALKGGSGGGGKYYYFEYLFKDNCFIKAFANTNSPYVKHCDGNLYPLHVSCSDTFDYNGNPTKGEHPPVAKVYILKKLNEDCSGGETCLKDSFHEETPISDTLQPPDTDAPSPATPDPIPASPMNDPIPVVPVPAAPTPVVPVPAAPTPAAPTPAAPIPAGPPATAVSPPTPITPPMMSPVASPTPGPVTITGVFFGNPFKGFPTGGLPTTTGNPPGLGPLLPGAPTNENPETPADIMSGGFIDPYYPNDPKDDDPDNDLISPLDPLDPPEFMESNQPEPTNTGTTGDGSSTCDCADYETTVGGDGATILTNGEGATATLPPGTIWVPCAQVVVTEVNPSTGELGEEKCNLTTSCIGAYSCTYEADICVQVEFFAPDSETQAQFQHLDGVTQVTSGGQTAISTQYVCLGEGETGVVNGYLTATGPIKGTVFYDTDSDGTYEPTTEEPVKTSPTVTLVFANNNTIATTVTADPDTGVYEFEEVPLGIDYVVYVDDTQPGVEGTKYKVTTTSPPNIGADTTSQDFPSTEPFKIDLANPVEYDLGIINSPDIIVNVCLEVDGNNNCSDGEPEDLVGVPVTITDPSGNPIDTQPTGPDGTVVFEDLPPGNYEVVVGEPPKDENDLDGTPIPNNPNPTPVDTTDGNPVTVDNGFHPTKPVTLTNCYDYDKDKVCDPDEPKDVPGLVTTLTPEGGSPISPTDPTSPVLTFEDVPVGPITFTTQYPDDLTPTTGTTSNPTDLPKTVTEDGPNDFDQGFLGPNNDLHGTVCEDKDQDAICDSDEEGIPGTVTVTNKDDPSETYNPPVDPETGNWDLPDLPPGTYVITTTPPDTPDYFPTTPTEVERIIPDPNDPNPSSPDKVDTGFVPGVPVMVDVCIEYYGANNVCDEPDLEDAVDDVPVVLTNKDDPTITYTSQTGDDGTVTFDSVKPGDYTLTVTNPDPTKFDPSDSGSPDGAPTQDVKVVVPPENTDPNHFHQGFGPEEPNVIGTVCVDIETNNVCDSEEDPIKDVPVTLTPKDPTSGLPTVTDDTDEEGNYGFTVPPGVYDVTFGDVPDHAPTDPDGNQTEEVTVPSILENPEPIEQDQGYLPNSDVTVDVCIEYSDADNICDDDDEPMPGTTVVLKDPQGNVIQSEETPTEGPVTFENVPPGTYTVEVLNPDDEVFKPTENDGNDDGRPTQTVTVTPEGPNHFEQGFEPIEPNVQGTVCVDVNQDNICDEPTSEEPLDGVEVTITPQDPDSGLPTKTTDTDENGDYSFTVPPGNYNVIFEDPSEPDDKYAPTDPEKNRQEPITAPAPGDEPVEQDQGFIPVRDVTVNVCIEDDTTYDNECDDADDEIYEGTEVTLSGPKYEPLTKTVEKSPDGTKTSVVFEDVPVGEDYTVVTKQPTGETLAPTDDDGDATQTLNVVENPDPTDPSQDNVIDQGFKEPKTTLTVFVCEDTDKDGCEPGEDPIPGATVQLNGPDGPTGITDENGIITFTDPPEGNIPMTVTPPDQDPPLGPTENVPDDPTTPPEQMVTIQENEPNEASQGFAPPDISGTVCVDWDVNDDCEEGEDPVGGTTVELIDPKNPDTPIQTTTTDPEDGTYNFYNVPVQEPTDEPYVIKVPKDDIPEDVVNNPIFTDDDTDGEKPLEEPFNGTPVDNQDQGVYPTRDVIVNVCEDLDIDQTCDPEEEKLGGVPVTLVPDPTNPFEDPIEGTTPDGGTVVFEDVPVGKYNVETTTPTDKEYMPTDDDNNAVQPIDVPESTTDEPVEVDQGFAPVQDVIVYVCEEVYAGRDNVCDDADDTPLDGIKVTLVPVSNPDIDPVTLTTGEDDGPPGTVTFPKAPHGDYTVVVEKPTDTPDENPSSDADTPSDGSTEPEQPLTVDGTDGTPKVVHQGFVEEPETPNEPDPDNEPVSEAPATVTVVVCIDTNENGVCEDDEDLVPDTTVTLLPKDDPTSPVDTKETDPNGEVTFTEVPSGEYDVVVERPEENGKKYDPTENDDSPNDPKQTVAVEPGDNTVVDQGLLKPPATIQVEVCIDTNENGICEDGEEDPIPGSTVDLIDPTTGTPIESKTVPEDGSPVVFENVTPDKEYEVVVTPPTPDDYTPTSDDDDQPEDSPATTKITPQPGADEVIEQGFTPVTTNVPTSAPTTKMPTTALPQIKGTVCIDLDYGDDCDTSEDDVEGATVNLYDPSDLDNPIDTTTTKPNGEYEFFGVEPDDYVIEIIPPSTIEDPFFTDLDSDTPDSIPTEPRDGIKYVVVPEEVNEWPVVVEHGLVPTRDIVVTECVDLDYDRVCDDTEERLPGLDVFLEPTGDNKVPSDWLPIPEITDPDDGTFTFKDVPIGDYTVKTDPQNLPDDKTYSPTDEAPGATQTVNVPEDTSGGSPEPVEVDQGWIPTHPVKVNVCVETNPGFNDLCDDPEDSPISDVPVTIRPKDPNDPRPTFTGETTDPNGVVEYPEVPEGVYEVVVDEQPDLTPSNGDEPVQELTVDDDEEVDQGFHPDAPQPEPVVPATVVVTVCVDDLTKDGSCEPSKDDPITQVDVYFGDPDDPNTPPPVQTDPDGQVTFDNLIPDEEYEIYIKKPDGMDPTSTPDDEDEDYVIYTVTPNPGETVEVDQAFVLPTDAPTPSPTGKANILGRIFLDFNLNGVYDDGDEPIPNFDVTLEGPDGPITVQTDDEGNYEFPVTPNENNKVTIPVGPGQFVTTDTDPDIGPTTNAEQGSSPEVSVGPGETEEVNGGLSPPTTATVKVCVDMNGDGMCDEDEDFMIDPKTVTLGDDQSPSNPSTGVYTFDPVIPGEPSYTLSIDPPDDYTAPVSDPLEEGVTINPGDVPENVFHQVLLPPTKIFGHVFDDPEKERDPEHGSTYPLGRDVILKDEEGNVVDTTTSDSSTGYYEFTKIPFGEYTVAFEDFDDTDEMITTRYSDDVGMKNGEAKTKPIELTSTDITHEANIGLTGYSTIKGIMFHDQGVEHTNPEVETFMFNGLFEPELIFGDVNDNRVETLLGAGYNVVARQYNEVGGTLVSTGETFSGRISYTKDCDFQSRQEFLSDEMKCGGYYIKVPVSIVNPESKYYIVQFNAPAGSFKFVFQDKDENDNEVDPEYLSLVPNYDPNSVDTSVIVVGGGGQAYGTIGYTSSFQIAGAGLSETRHAAVAGQSDLLTCASNDKDEGEIINGVLVKCDYTNVQLSSYGLFSVPLDILYLGGNGRRVLNNRTSNLRGVTRVTSKIVETEVYEEYVTPSDE